MVKTEKATRLPPREGSFADLRDENVIHHPLEYEGHGVAPHLEQPVRLSATKTKSNGESSTADLIGENELLRRQIDDLQAQVSDLRHRYVNQPKQREEYPIGGTKAKSTSFKKVASAPGVVLELPRAMKYNSMDPLSCLREKNRPTKDHQSFATDDDQSTVEPTHDWEVHDSLGGLKHRNSLHYPAVTEAPKPPHRRPQHKASSPTDATRRTEPLSHDGSFSSQADDSETQSNDEGGEYDMESRELIPHAATSTDARPNTSRAAGQEEESMWSIVSDRAGWLVGLLVLQSMSSFIIARNEALLQRHLVIIRFLTMLVGAGGNAGNQASVRVIRGLAVGSIDSSNQRRFLKREFTMGLALSIVLGVAGCIRAAVFMTPWLETLAITTSLFMIVIISIVLGALLPLGMKKVGIDPAHSSTTIQVVMDILGVTITVWMSSLVLDSNFKDWLSSSFLDA